MAWAMIFEFYPMVFDIVMTFQCILMYFYFICLQALAGIDVDKPHQMPLRAEYNITGFPTIYYFEYVLLHTA